MMNGKPQHRIFLDTNILLSFYEVSKNDIDQLSKAVELALQQEIVFVCTTVVRDEFLRRRSGVIAKSLEEFSSAKLPHIPVMARTLSSTAAYLDARKAFEISQRKLEAELREQAENNSLEADKLIDRFFGIVRMIDLTPAIRDRALLRIDIGSPPGKRGSLGDALNWELLLSLGSDRSLTLVSDDVDYRDRLCKSEFNRFLQEEWSNSHDGPIKYFQSLSDYVSSELNLPQFGLVSAVDDKVDALASSKSFAQTHAAIAELSAVAYFTTKQVSYLVEVLNANNQVNWIAEDADVRDFYRRLIVDYKDKLDEAQISFVLNCIEPIKPSVDDIFS